MATFSQCPPYYRSVSSFLYFGQHAARFNGDVGSHIAGKGLHDGTNTLLFRYAIEVRLVPVVVHGPAKGLREYEFDPAIVGVHE